MGRKGLKLSEASRGALLDHSWPGNIRELQNCLERGAILCSGTQIEPEHLLLSAGPSGGPSLGDGLDLSGTLTGGGERAGGLAEDEAVALALRETAGDRPAGAARLGISPSALNRTREPAGA